MKKGKGVLWRAAGILLLVFILLWELNFLYVYASWDNPSRFRRMELNPKAVSALSSRYGYGSGRFLDALTGRMLSNGFRLSGNPAFYFMESVPCRLFMKPAFSRYKAWYRMILNDLACFPVSEDQTGGESLSFDDSWMGERTYGGRRFHEGTDIMTSNNVRGYFSVVSMTDGVVEKLGWLEKGGYRVGIRGPSGAYFYYAHLSSYAPGLKQGDRVKAGQVLGQMGDSGYGPEGTFGKFDVHLHVGIYLTINGEEWSVNPYSILLYLKNQSRNERKI